MGYTRHLSFRRGNTFTTHNKPREKLRLYTLNLENSNGAAHSKHRISCRTVMILATMIVIMFCGVCYSQDTHADVIPLQTGDTHRRLATIAELKEQVVANKKEAISFNKANDKQRALIYWKMMKLKEHLI